MASLNYIDHLAVRPEVPWTISRLYCECDADYINKIVEEKNKFVASDTEWLKRNGLDKE